VIRLWFVVACIVVLASPSVARACAVCGCGDPTLTVMGDEKTFAGRARASAELRIGHVRVGTPGIDETGMSEERLELSGAYAPTRSLLLVLAVPLLYRQPSFHDGATSRFFTIGDIELRAKLFVWEARRSEFQHRIALQGGIKAPSGPVERDDRGAPLPSALQPGLGAVTPFAGLFYGLGRGPWSFYASATAYLPYAVRDSAHASDSLRISGTVARQVGRTFAGRIGLDTRLDASGEAGGKPDPNSGGFVAYLSPAIVVSPVVDLLLVFGAHVPFAQALHGQHHEATIATTSVTYDF
jgi:hypothetical protein